MASEGARRTRLTRQVIGALLGAVLLTLPACRQGGGVVDNLRVQWTLTPPTPIVGHAAAFEIVVHDADDAPVLDADLDFEGHMTHPGMAPVIVPLVASGSGRYLAADIAFTMGGDWVIVVSGRLRDGRLVRQRVAELVVRGAG